MNRVNVCAVPHQPLGTAMIARNGEVVWVGPLRGIPQSIGLNDVVCLSQWDYDRLLRERKPGPPSPAEGEGLPPFPRGGC